jgi:hypothetical protein
MRNILAYYGIPKVDGYDALFSQHYGELLYSVRTEGKLTNQITRTDADLSPPGQGERIENNPYRLRLMQLLGVKYVMETKMINPLLPVVSLPSQFHLVYEDASWRIFDYADALPRAWLASSVIVQPDKQGQLDALYNPTIDLTSTVILSMPPEKLPVQPLTYLSSPTSSKTVEIQSYQPTEVTIHTTADEDHVLVLSDTYFPGWEATVDGKTTPIYLADYAFRGVYVPGGEHTIQFSYHPRSFTIAAGTGIVSFLLTTFFLSWLVLRRRDIPELPKR